MKQNTEKYLIVFYFAFHLYITFLWDGMLLNWGKRKIHKIKSEIINNNKIIHYEMRRRDS